MHLQCHAWVFLPSCVKCGQHVWEHAERMTETDCQELIFLVCFCTSLGTDTKKDYMKMGLQIAVSGDFAGCPQTCRDRHVAMGTECKRVTEERVARTWYSDFSVISFVKWGLRICCVAGRSSGGCKALRVCACTHNTFQYCYFKPPLCYTCVCVRAKFCVEIPTTWTIWAASDINDIIYIIRVWIRVICLHGLEGNTHIPCVYLVSQK